MYVYFCSVNGQYMKQGKLGAAVLGNHTDKEVRVDLALYFHLVHSKCLRLNNLRII